MTRLLELPGEVLINPLDVESVQEIRTMPVRCRVQMRSGRSHEVRASYRYVKKMLDDALSKDSEQ